MRSTEIAAERRVIAVLKERGGLVSTELVRRAGIPGVAVLRAMARAGKLVIERSSKLGWRSCTHAKVVRLPNQPRPPDPRRGWASLPPRSEKGTGAKRDVKAPSLSNSKFARSLKRPEHDPLATYRLVDTESRTFTSPKLRLEVALEFLKSHPELDLALYSVTSDAHDFRSLKMAGEAIPIPVELEPAPQKAPARPSKSSRKAA